MGTEEAAETIANDLHPVCLGNLCRPHFLSLLLAASHYYCWVSSVTILSEWEEEDSKSHLNFNFPRQENSSDAVQPNSSAKTVQMLFRLTKNKQNQQNEGVCLSGGAFQIHFHSCLLCPFQISSLFLCFNYLKQNKPKPKV